MHYKNISPASVFEKKNQERVFSIIVYIFCLAILVAGLMRSGLWADEWVEYMVSRLSLTNGDMRSIILTTFQPPLYNWLMHFWLKISDSVIWFRAFNLVPVLVSLVCFRKILRQFGSALFSWVGILLLSLSFTWVYMALEAAEYCLMMGFLFLQAYWLMKIQKEYSLAGVCFFILSGVGAIWSQYGAAFAAGSMFLVWLVVLLKEKMKREALVTAGLYVLSLVVFALPLWFFFARYQVAANEISDHVQAVSLSIPDYLSSFGLLVDYFLMYPMRFETLFSILGWILYGAMVVYVVMAARKRDRAWSLILSLLIAYSILYLLVELHIYAMIHADESRGLFFRYSDCLLPLYWTAVPVLIWKGTACLKKSWRGPAWISVSLVAAFFALFSIGDIARGWDKSHDDEFMELLEEEGKDAVSVYYLGRAWENSDYYRSRSPLVINRLDSLEQIVEEQPDEFYVIRSVWGGEEELDELEEGLDGYSIKKEVEYERDGILDYGGTWIHYVRT